jgi:hypothetical protein
MLVRRTLSQNLRAIRGICRTIPISTQIQGLPPNHPPSKVLRRVGPSEIGRKMKINYWSGVAETQKIDWDLF